MKEDKQINLQLLRFWENDKVPTKVGVSLSLSQCKVAPLIYQHSVVIPHLVRQSTFFKLKGKRANQQKNIILYNYFKEFITEGNPR
jgi:hypothetical protein